MRTIVLGAGMTGIAAGRTSNGIIYESCERPGGLCASYHIKGYRFEIGGGHWIFGGDPAVRRLLRGVAPMSSYRRRSAVYFSKQQRYAPYPLQNNLQCLDLAIAEQAAEEMKQAAADWTTTSRRRP